MKMGRVSTLVWKHGPGAFFFFLWFVPRRGRPHQFNWVHQKPLLPRKKITREKDRGTPTPPTPELRSIPTTNVHCATRAFVVDDPWSCRRRSLLPRHQGAPRYDASIPKSQARGHLGFFFGFPPSSARIFCFFLLPGIIQRRRRSED